MKSIVVIPTYNERDNIEILARAILDLPHNIEVLIVDDNSPDGTGEIADKLAKENPRAHVIHRAGKSGLGTAYLEGFKYVLGQGFDYILQMDADLSHDPKYIPDFLERMKDSDLVLGSRYTKGISVVNWNFRRLLLSKAANAYVQLVTGIKFTDLTGGFKCFRRHVLENINLKAIHSSGYAMQVEMTYRAWKKGFKIEETPIIFIERNTGSSKMSKKDIIEAFFIPWRLRMGFYRK